MNAYPGQKFYFEFHKQFGRLEADFQLGPALLLPPGGLVGGLTSQTEWNLYAVGFYIKKSAWIFGLGLSTFLRIHWLP